MTLAGQGSATIVLRCPRTPKTFLPGALLSDRCGPRYFRTTRWRSATCWKKLQSGSLEA